MGRKIGSKNKLKQTQKQSQVVNVNITQEKKLLNVNQEPRNQVKNHQHYMKLGNHH